MREFEKIASILPPRLKNILLEADENLKQEATEIRILKNSPLALTTPKGRVFIDKNGNPSAYKNALITDEKEIGEIALRIMDYSYYAYEKDIERGFLTLKGGHRVGLSGKGEIFGGKTLLKEITSFNFRIAKEIDGASDEVFPLITEPKFYNAVIMSPPCGGKTTVLRDLAKKLSVSGKAISVVDCLGELSMGGNTLFSCDVLEGFLKRDGIIHALRFLSPEIILCDEITTIEEAFDIESGMNSGVGFVVTSHASDLKDAESRPVTRKLLELFDIAVFLEGRNSPGKIKEVIPLV